MTVYFLLFMYRKYKIIYLLRITIVVVCLVLMMVDLYDKEMILKLCFYFMIIYVIHMIGSFLFWIRMDLCLSEYLQLVMTELV